MNIFNCLFSVNCTWSDWSSTTTCSKTCGGGKQLRFRTISRYEEYGGNACDVDDNNSEVDCNTENCPKGIFIFRYYYEISSKSLISVSINNSIIHLKVNCSWSDWSSATTCSKSCGGGKQLRFRTITKHEENGGAACDVNDNTSEVDCNTNDCPKGLYIDFFSNIIKYLLSN